MASPFAHPVPPRDWRPGAGVAKPGPGRQGPATRGTPMSQEIRQAFAHPVERSEAGGGPRGPLDRIALRDHVVEVEIGAFQAERGHTQRVRFNIVVEVRRPAGPLGDDVDRILSYDKVTEAIAHELAAERVNLLETLAERVARRILLEPQAMRTFVRIEKLDRGPGALGVEIVRDRRDLPQDLRRAAARAEADGRPHPVVLFLPDSALDTPRLADWLDELQAAHLPVLICVGAPRMARPRSAAPLAQRRIDLLAIEQNAWVLAGRDPRCVVVDSRTELDWAMRHGQVSVWAPSKIVLDSVEGPRGTSADGLELALWLAEQMEARDVVLIGADGAPGAGAGAETTAPAAGAAPRRHLPADAPRLLDA